MIKDPRVIGGAGVLGLVLLGEQRSRTTSVRRIDVLGPDELASGEEDVFLADVLDGSGKPVTTPPVWQSDKPAVVFIDPATGRVEAKGPGVAVITATAGGIVRRVRLKVIGQRAGSTGELTEGTDPPADGTNPEIEGSSPGSEGPNPPAKKAVAAKKAVPAKKAIGG